MFDCLGWVEKTICGEFCGICIEQKFEIIVIDINIVDVSDYRKYLLFLKIGCKKWCQW